MSRRHPLSSIRTSGRRWWRAGC